MDPLDVNEQLYGDSWIAEPALGPMDIGEPFDLGDAAKINRLADVVNQQIDKIGELFDAEIRQLNDRRDEQLGPLVERREELRRKVENWHRAQLAARKATPTVHFPHGPPSALRSNPLKADVTDPDALERFMAETPTSDGEYLDAVCYSTPAPPEFRVSELKKRVELPGTPKGGHEAGTEVTATYKHPSGVVVEVPGIVWRSSGRRWQQRA
jgi:hypothetical protein